MGDMEGVWWNPAIGRFVDKAAEPKGIGGKAHGLAPEQGQRQAQAAEIEQKIAALRQQDNAFNGAYSTLNRAPDYSEQPAAMGTADPHAAPIPHEYQEDYRNADMWTGAARWPGLFRQVVEELGQRDATITQLHGKIDELQKECAERIMKLSLTQQNPYQDELHHLRTTSGAYEEEVLQLRSKVDILEKEISRLIEREWVLVAQERYKAADQIRKLEAKIDRAKEVLA